VDAVGIRSRISSLRSLLVAALAGAAALTASACTKSDADAHPSYRDSYERAPGAATAESDAEPAERATVASSTAGEFARVERAIRRYAADRAGRLPVNLEALTKDVSPEGDRYLTRLPVDAWGRPYAYAVVSARLGAYDLRSYGPDNLPGTADDLVAEAQPVPVH
jgi:hypothetical protein